MRRQSPHSIGLVPPTLQRDRGSMVEVTRSSCVQLGARFDAELVPKQDTALVHTLAAPRPAGPFGTGPASAVTNAVHEVDGRRRAVPALRSKPFPSPGRLPTDPRARPDGVPPNANALARRAATRRARRTVARASRAKAWRSPDPRSCAGPDAGSIHRATARSNDTTSTVTWALDKRYPPLRRLDGVGTDELTQAHHIRLQRTGMVGVVAGPELRRPVRSAKPSRRDGDRERPTRPVLDPSSVPRHRRRPRALEARGHATPPAKSTWASGRPTRSGRRLATERPKCDRE